MNGRCSKHLTGKLKNIILLKALQVGSILFCDGKKRYGFCEGMIEKSMEHTIKDVYYVYGLK